MEWLYQNPIWLVFFYASLTAVATGLGALPFLLVKKVPDLWLGHGNAIASGLMLAASWSIFSSLPQPLMAVPAFLFVLAFKPWLPVGLGFAAGAMIWMVFSELLPESYEKTKPVNAAVTATIAIIAMMLFQALIN